MKVRMKRQAREPAEKLGREYRNLNIAFEYGNLNTEI